MSLDDKDIGSELITQNLSGDSENSLEFDPETGELVVRRRDELQNPDATTVDQIATDGFAS